MDPHAHDKSVRHKMVGWYDPGQLIQTGIQVLISQIFGARSDYRLIETFSGPQDPFDYSKDEADDGFWFDFVADLGDGWDPTYAVACLLAQETLEVKSHYNEPLTLPRGRFLVMGGDEVYPVASRENYQERMVEPYKAAFPYSDAPHPALFAIPGNHDWYDGLISFNRLFCEPRWIGGWRTQQKRSYFAIKLPHNWWLWSLDYQLVSDIDEAQRDFFCKVADQMEPGAKVILASAEPDWIYGNIYDSKFQKNIAFLQSKVIEGVAQAKLKVAISGDLHHYRRHEAEDGSGTQLVTSGGGGAFTIGTFGPHAEEITVGKEPARKYVRKAEYPDRKTSVRLLRRTLLFPFFNPKFGLMTGLLYLVIAWLYREPILAESERFLKLANHPLSGASAIAHAILGSPFGFGVLALVIVGFVAFTDTHSKPYKYLGGGAHACANLSALLMLTALASHVSRDVLHFPDQSLLYLISTATLIFVGGYVAGAVIMGVYLYISLRVFRRHTQEAMSAQRLTSYKNFVRFHISPDGELTMYPIGLRRTPRRWKKSQASSSPDGHKRGPKFVPVREGALRPEMIEPPVKVK